jgi:hypothetical protein
LVRWHHPRHGLVSPATFIPLAEESGLIFELGEWILRTACREAASWPRPLHIAVNLSPVQFRYGDLPTLVHEVLLETGLPPGRLELEITEGVLIGDFNRAVSILRRLKALGVLIAMDDFGTGYSSLSYLQSFPFDKIKIDKSFITNLGHRVGHHRARGDRARPRARHASGGGGCGDRRAAQVPRRRKLRRNAGLLHRPAETDRGLCRTGRASGAAASQAQGRRLIPA